MYRVLRTCPRIPCASYSSSTHNVALHKSRYGPYPSQHTAALADEECDLPDSHDTSLIQFGHLALSSRILRQEKACAGGDIYFKASYPTLRAAQSYLCIRGARFSVNRQRPVGIRIRCVVQGPGHPSFESPLQARTQTRGTYSWASKD